MPNNQKVSAPLSKLFETQVHSVTPWGLKQSARLLEDPEGLKEFLRTGGEALEHLRCLSGYGEEGKDLVFSVFTTPGMVSLLLQQSGVEPDKLFTLIHDVTSPEGRSIFEILSTEGKTTWLLAQSGCADRILKAINEDGATWEEKFSVLSSESGAWSLVYHCEDIDNFLGFCRKQTLEHVGAIVSLRGVEEALAQRRTIVRGRENVV